MSTHARERGAALHNLTKIDPNPAGRAGQQHAPMFSCVVIRWIFISRIGCLWPLFLALSTALVIVWVVISELMGRRYNKVQTVFLTLILGRKNHRGVCRVLVQYTHTILRSAFGEYMELCVWYRSVNYVAVLINSYIIIYQAPHWVAARRPGVDMMSIILFLPVEISTDRSTDWPCALDMCNTDRSFTHWSNACVITRLSFLNLGFIEQMSCTPIPVTLYNLASQNSGLSTNLKIENTEILFQNLQIFHDILLNLANFGGRPMTKSMQIPGKRIETVGNHVIFVHNLLFYTMTHQK